MSVNMYDWERCSHEGIGLPGCSVCDPDKERVMIRQQRLDNRDLREQLATLTRERDEARAQVLDLVRARHETQALHGNALAAVTAERDRMREELVMTRDRLRTRGAAFDNAVFREAHRALEARVRGRLDEMESARLNAVQQSVLLEDERDEARADAARKGEALKVLRDDWRATTEDLTVFGEDVIRAALADTTSDAWLAEVKALARDEALEEAADFIDNTERWPDGAEIRALKRGGK